VQLVCVATKVIQFRKRIVHVLPAAAEHGAKSGHGVQQGAGLEYVEAVNPESNQGPSAVRLAHPPAAAVNPDRLEQVLGQLAGNGARRFNFAVGCVPVLQADADGFVFPADRNQYAVKVPFLGEGAILGLWPVPSGKGQQFGRGAVFAFLKDAAYGVVIGKADVDLLEYLRQLFPRGGYRSDLGAEFGSKTTIS